jgi:tRNA(fMet)-specific endonuclease VapC
MTIVVILENVLGSDKTFGGAIHHYGSARDSLRGKAGAEKSARRAENLTAIEHFVARLDVLPFDAKAAAHYGQLRAELARAGTPCGPHDMQIGGHARAEGLIVVTNNLREFSRMPGVRVEDWV